MEEKIIEKGISVKEKLENTVINHLTCDIIIIAYRGKPRCSGPPAHLPGLPGTGDAKYIIIKIIIIRYQK